MKMTTIDLTWLANFIRNVGNKAQQGKRIFYYTCIQLQRFIFTCKYPAAAQVSIVARLLFFTSFFLFVTV